MVREASRPATERLKTLPGRICWGVGAKGRWAWFRVGLLSSFQVVHDNVFTALRASRHMPAGEACEDHSEADCFRTMLKRFKATQRGRLSEHMK